MSALLALWLAGAAAAAGPSVPEHPVRVVAAGDIASCSETADDETAKLLDVLPGIVLTLGDNAYSRGTPREFAECYAPTWGRHKRRTHPIPGNHDYQTKDAAGYFDYFGERAGTRGQGWYSFDRGGWHFVALNSNCAKVGGCGRSSPQGLWLEADLRAHPSRCTLAYWHHPRFSSGSDHGNSTATRDFWAILQEHGADLVLSGHEHSYERFAAQDADGRADPRGLRQFVVGTGGSDLYEMGSPVANSEVREDRSHGVLALELAPDGYAWEFHPIAGDPLHDRGVGRCVTLPPTLSVSSPADGASFAKGKSISFEARADDAEEGDLSARIRWRSDRDGEIGVGSALRSAGLSCGTHHLTASVTDQDGGREARELSIAIGPKGCS